MKYFKEKLTAAMVAVILVSVSVYANYDRFILSTDAIEVSISNMGLKLDPKAALAIDPETGFKDSAIAMAIGYCAFLKLTDIHQDLMTASQNNTELVNKIMSGLGVNYWLTTAWQESHLAMEESGKRTQDYPVQSGWFQIDNTPQMIYDQATNKWYGWKAGAETASPYYSFIKYLIGGTVAGPTTENAILCHTDQKGFTWAALEMAYFTGYSYNANKNPYNNICPTPPYFLPDWLVKYAGEQGNATDFPFTGGLPITVDGKICEIPKKGASLDPCYIGTMFLGFLYNRGQNPFSSPTYKPSEMFIKMIDSNNALAEGALTPYPTTMPDPNDPVVWGRRYFWQFGWVISMLNQSTSHYQEIITKEDVLRVLEYLKGYYNKGVTTGDDLVLQVGIEKLDSLSWGDTYDSSTTFDNIKAVTEAMMEASKKGL